MSRELDFTTTTPPETVTTDRAAMEWFIAQADGQPMMAVPPLYTADWIGDYLEALPDQTRASEVAATATTRRLDVLREVRAGRPGLACTPMLVSVPHPVDLALLTCVGPTVAWKITNLMRLRDALHHLPTYVSAVAGFMAAVSAAAGPEVLFDLQMPSALLTMQMARFLPHGRTLAAQWHSSVTAKLLSQLPTTATFALRFCADDDLALPAEPVDLAAPVAYLNQLARAINHQQLLQLRTQTRRPGRADRLRPRRFPAVHLPPGFGGRAPSSDAAFYAALTKLDSRWTRLIADVAIADDLPTSDAALALLETATGERAAAVGCVRAPARYGPDQAKASVSVQRHLARADVPTGEGATGVRA